MEHVGFRGLRLRRVVSVMAASLVLISILGSFALWCFIHRLRQRGKTGFKTWPLVGSSLSLRANYNRIHDWLLESFEEQGCETLIVPLLGHSYIGTADPLNVEHILKSNFSNYPKGNFFCEKFQELLGRGIFNSDGEAWKFQRKTASFEFASRVLRDFSFQVFSQYALKLSDIIGEFSAAGRVFDIQDLFLRMTLDTICRVGFDVEVGVLSSELPANEFATAFDKCNEIVSYRFADPLWKLKRALGLGQEGSLKHNIRVVDDFTYGIIRKRRAKLEQQMTGQGNQQDHQVKKQNDLLSRFMTLDLRLSDKELRDIILNFVIAGRDTTADTLAWFVYELATHPAVGVQLQQELREFDGVDDLNTTRFSKQLNYESLARLPYLHAALMETLRLHPAVALNFKSVLDDDVLPNGTKVEKGGIVAYSPWCMGRLETLWGSDARQFRPERWCKSGAWDFNVSPFKFATFQAGPRICLGRDSAYLQMKITAAILCRFFTFVIAPEQGPVTYRVMATMCIANGLKVQAMRP